VLACHKSVDLEPHTLFWSLILWILVMKVPSVRFLFIWTGFSLLFHVLCMRINMRYGDTSEGASEFSSCHLCLSIYVNQMIIEMLD